MYTTYFSLKQLPFSIAPDPRYLFMSERHREALAHLLYGVGSGGGFVLLTGEIGAGKTTVCRCFMEQVPDNCRLAYIFNPRLTVEELLLSICDEFGIAPAGPGPVGVKGYVDAINGYLLQSHAEGKNNVLVIDEAQNLSPDVLEQLRLLTNLETNERKLLQIILIGQPELRTMLARPELEQLAQRVIARYHLGPLGEAETSAYVAHRLAVAGVTAATPFPRALTPLIQRLTHGVPRRINLLCDRALLGAYVSNSPAVTPLILRTAAAEVFSEEGGTVRPPRRWPLVAGSVLAGAALSAAAAWQVLPHRSATPAATAVPLRASAAMAPAPAPHGVLVGHATEAEALRELATLWGPALPAGEPCAAALKLNLRCHQGRGGLYELRQLDRPAMVTLHDGQKRSHALLVAMDDASVTLSAGGKRETVPVAALAKRFGGEFTTFWKMPRTFREQLAVGDTGPDADWIAARLAQLNRVDAPPAGSAFDARMQKMLHAFQLQQNLKADGVAGPRTYMRLNSLGGVAEPRLLAAGTGK
jgi:general secretion pathway protein A